MTTIAERSVLVTHLSESPTTDLEAPYAYAESPQAVRLTAEELRRAGGKPLQVDSAWAARLDLLYLTSTGTTDGVPLGSHSTATVTLTGVAETVIPAQTTVKKSADATLWETGAASLIPVGQTTKALVVTCQEAGPEAADAHALAVISPAVSGLSAVDNALAATPGALRLLTLRLLDQRTGGIVQIRRSTVETVAGSGIYQIAADTDQRSRLATVGDGNAGRLVIRWGAADDSPPPVGRWDWTLTVAHPDGAEIEARGEIEVLA